MNNKQILWVVGGLVAFVLIIGMGYSIGQILSIKNDQTDVKGRLATIEKTAGSSAAKLKVGVVLINDISARLQKDPKYVDQFTTFSNKLIDLQQQYNDHKLSKEEYGAQYNPLNAQLNQLGQDLILRPLQDAINQVGMSGNYDLIVKAEDVVLFSQHNIMENITEKVWSQIQGNK